LLTKRRSIRRSDEDARFLERKSIRSRELAFFVAVTFINESGRFGGALPRSEHQAPPVGQYPVGRRLEWDRSEKSAFVVEIANRSMAGRRGLKTPPYVLVVDLSTEDPALHHRK
jgi:hypothetical protein